TPFEAITAVNAVYRTIYGCNPLSENPLGDDATANSPGSVFDTYTFDATSGDIAWDWPQFFGMIYQANVCLSKIPAIDFAGYTGTNIKASLIAQTTFFRAYGYFSLVKRYGGVPLITEPLSALTPEKVQIPRATADAVWAQIETDLKAAIPDLPTGWDDINVGRVTKGAALGYLAKVYMYEKRWADAKATFETLMALTNVNKGTNNGYALLSNFDDNFNLSANQKWGSEAVWQVSNTNQIRFANGANWGGGANHEIGIFINWGGPKPNLYAVAQYTAADTIRLKSSITGTLTDESSLMLAKYGGNKNAFDNWEGTGKYNGINVQLLRFSDVLLMYAEACNELGGANTAIAITNLNKVRTRANVPVYPYVFNSTVTYTPVTGSGTQADVRNAIKQERLLEFFCEDQRYWDLMRWGDGVAAFAAANAYETSKGSTNSIQAWKPNKNELWPIPTAEYQLNKNIGANNPGY
ncbi:MAG TPA: RagB/SusD family nutrient uptake outer membrane protein, partial [Bacteroidales bacterium]